MAGRLTEALEYLAEARHLAEETENAVFADTVRLRGDVVLAIGDRAGAEVIYREAMALAQHQNAKLWELRAAMSLARLWRDQGKRAAAHDLLAPVHGWFTEGLDTPVLQGARALLVELSDAPARLSDRGWVAGC
jgi:predicted ATPase